MNSLITGTESSWQPTMTADTTASSYWLNWRLFLCSIWIMISMALSVLLIRRFEGIRSSRRSSSNSSVTQQVVEEEEVGTLYEDETWRPCLKGVHPAWLLAFRFFAYVGLLVLLIITVCVDGGTIFYFYTQWTFTLVSIYFGLGSLLSMRGCYRYHKKTAGERVDSVEVDTEHGNVEKSVVSHVEQQHQSRHPAGILGYIFQIIFQMIAGAVVLTDCVFWFIIVPFLTIKDYDLNFLIVNMHTINAVFLLGETALNSLPFPWFRIGYFYLWTITYVIFQWILHACVKIWWPYPFLDLSSSYAPLWYLSVGLLHLLCYGVFALLMKLKHHLFLTKCPDSYQRGRYTRSESR